MIVQEDSTVIDYYAPFDQGLKLSVLLNPIHTTSLVEMYDFVSFYLSEGLVT